jgi:hypothetical protein
MKITFSFTVEGSINRSSVFRASIRDASVGEVGPEDKDVACCASVRR